MSYPSCQSKELKGLTVKQLQSLAKREGLTGYTKLKKDELCREIAKVLSAKGKSAPKSAMKKSSGGPKKSVRFAGDKKRLLITIEPEWINFDYPDGLYPETRQGLTENSDIVLLYKFLQPDFKFKIGRQRAMMYTKPQNDWYYAVEELRAVSLYKIKVNFKGWKTN